MNADKSRVGLWISLAALTLSLVATVTSVYFSQASLRTSILPTLVFVYSVDSGWAVRNIGNGPAINVVLAVEPSSGSGWQSPTQLYPVPVAEQVWLPWVGHNPKRLGVTYTDAYNRTYTSICDNDLTVINGGERLPEWPRDAV